MQLLLNDDVGMELQHVAVSTLNFLDLVSGPAYYWPVIMDRPRPLNYGKCCEATLTVKVYIYM